MTTLEEKLVAGETLEGDAARTMLDELQTRPWRFWVHIALGYLQQGQPVQAEQVLKQLIESTLGCHTVTVESIPEADVQIKVATPESEQNHEFKEAARRYLRLKRMSKKGG